MPSDVAIWGIVDDGVAPVACVRSRSTITPTAVRMVYREPKCCLRLTSRYPVLVRLPAEPLGSQNSEDLQWVMRKQEEAKDLELPFAKVPSSARSGRTRHLMNYACRFSVPR